MGNCAPVFLAFVLNLSGINVFREIKAPGQEPLISSIIFLTSLAILLTDLRLYPGTLRKLCTFGAVFLRVNILILKFFLYNIYLFIIL